LKDFFILKKTAITKMQAAIIAIIVIVAIVVGAAYYYTTLPGPTPTPKEKIVIGCAISLSGPYSSGASLHSIPYYKWIVDEYNAKGGLYVPEYGRRIPIELRIVDDESSVDKMLTLTEKFITVDKVDLIFPPWGTAMNFAAISLYQKYHYPSVILTMQSDVASEKIKNGEYSYAFLCLAPPHAIGKAMADFIEYVNEYKTSTRRIGIIFVADQHGVENAGAVYRELYVRGFDIPVYQCYPIDIADFTPIIKTLSDANVDVLFASSYPADGALLVRQCMAQNYNPKIMILGPGIDVPGLVYGPFAFTKEDVKGIINYSSMPATAYKTPELQEWAEKHKQRIGAYPLVCSASFYAGLEALFQAVEKVGLDREKIRDALATQTFDTIAGKFRFVAGEGPEFEGAGCFGQWQGGEMMEVIWPLDVATADMICPKTPWP
jgi:branched-chain amino acid transport system substrate-binding protein